MIFHIYDYPAIILIFFWNQLIHASVENDKKIDFCKGAFTYDVRFLGK